MTACEKLKAALAELAPLALAEMTTITPEEIGGCAGLLYEVRNAADCAGRLDSLLRDAIRVQQKRSERSAAEDATTLPKAAD